MKKSIALFLTLIFLTSLIIIIGGIFAIYNKISSNDFYKNISQNSIIIKDINSSLCKLSKNIDKNNIKYIFNTFPISSKDGHFRAVISIKPLFNRIDINEINNEQIKTYLLNILENYQILDPVFFEDLILDTIDLDKIERVGGSEIILKNPFFKQGKIYNFTHLKEIINYYYSFTKDKNIYKVPWKKLFFFGNGNSIIDCDLLSKDVAKFLGLTLPEKISCKNLKNFEENRKIMKKLNIISFNKNVSYLVLINVKYNNQELNITYDINKKRIKDIESNILY